MRSICLLALLGACGGDPSEDPSATTVDALCEDVRSYNLAEATCDQLEGVYHQLIDDASACVIDTDCQALRSRCDVFFVNNCDVGVNTCIAQADIDAIAEAWMPCDPDPMASCLEPCPVLSTACIEGRCVVR